MQDSKSTTHEDTKPESDDVPRFDKSLQELRDLRSQLHYAADYCETAFLKTHKKKLVLVNTKEYICKAMITVVDHLGSVSANLNRLINGRHELLHTELLMDALQHRLLTCKQYSHELHLNKVRWNATSPRYHPRYSSTTLIQAIDRSNGATRDSTDPIVAESLYEKVPCTKKTSTHLTPEFEQSSVLPICDGPSIFSKPRSSSFGSQMQVDSPRLIYSGSNLMSEKKKKGGGIDVEVDSPRFRRHSNSSSNLNKKAVQSQSSNFMPFLRRSKRAT